MPSSALPGSAIWCSIGVLALGIACRGNTEPEPGAVPPPIASAAGDVCASGGGEVSDTETQAYFPRTVASFCIDRNYDTRVYGAGARWNLDDVCLQLLNGECESYKAHGLRRVVNVRYVAGQSADTVDVRLSKFSSTEGAFAFFSKRVTASSDPALTTVRKMSVAGAGALGSGIAYLWREKYLVELRYDSIAETPAAIVKLSDAELPKIASRIADALPPGVGLPASVRALPAEERIDLGVVYRTDGLFGLQGSGGGAEGYYRVGKKRYRVVAIARQDEDSAKDVINTIKREFRAKSPKNSPFPVLRFRLGGGDQPFVEWTISRRRSVVFAVGDESYALQAGMSQPDREQASIDWREKLRRLRPLLEGSTDP